GLAATSLAWGLWEPVSEMTGRLDEVDRQRMSRAGAEPMSAAEGMDMFERALAADRPFLMASKMNIPALRELDDSGQLPVVLRSLVRRLRKASARRDTARSYAERLVGLDEPQQVASLVELVRDNARTILGGTAPMGATQAFKSVGFDSLSAVELRNRLSAATGVKLPATLIFDYPTPEALAQFLRDKLLPAGETPAPVEVDPGRLRQWMSTVPLDRLREAGVLQTLAALAGSEGTAPAPATSVDLDLIAEMDTESLIARALGNVDN
ncbi:beta-ketoacyl reductase, partial [Micromonospora sp. DT31]|uniref:acyl carrier protein n=1 Tax=Micromonospora sp. DT31 TaxID=3393434 RepID=UPI003CE9088F